MTVALMMASCTTVPEAGVAYELAQSRKASISDVEYELFFSIPASKVEPVCGKETISFNIDRRSEVILDFLDDGTLSADEHIVIPRSKIKKGRNSFEFSFTSPDQSLNRRDEFLYTLLVPDRARTLFPCFDQPDMKASYKLTLEVPDSWTAVSNSAPESVEISGGRKTVHFAPTEPLSTYLFSFVAGRFECDSIVRAGKSIHLYHRETDPARIAQSGLILQLVCSSLDSLEAYTGIEYPFSKYDCVAIPDFQYGGMEHTGATLYRAERLFLGENPTTAELMNRASLIAHETAHMWFGDLVTMKWFNDVWTKEVFANWFAARLIRPLFPDTNYRLADMSDYYASAYAEDRTPGSNAVQRPLDNLKNAGLIYGNIIYDKAPVVMDMLVDRMGESAFRDGIRTYLKKFAYSNADWKDLIDVLSDYADFDVQEWSRVWIQEKGMPKFSMEVDGNVLTVRQSDPFAAGNIWQEPMDCLVIGEDGHKEEVRLDILDSLAVREMPFEIEHVIPNYDGRCYGCFLISDEDASYLEGIYSSIADDCARMSVLMTLYENALRGNIDRAAFMDWLSDSIDSEGESLILGSMLKYGAAIYWKSGCPERFVQSLRAMASDNKLGTEARLLAFRSLYAVAKNGGICDELYDVWADAKGFCGLPLGENDYTSMAYQLMLRFPEKASEIRAVQTGRISNPDRRETFETVSRACDGSKEVRDEFFRYLLTTEGRSIESRASKALSLLNHPLRDAESEAYILPGLEIIEDVQREGDIFFPQQWCSALIGGHDDAMVTAKIKKFLAGRPDLNPLLVTKILQCEIQE